jgi:hypothetical protein
MGRRSRRQEIGAEDLQLELTKSGKVILHRNTEALF